MPDLFESARRIPNCFAPPLAEWPDDAKATVEALQNECEIRDQGLSDCLADLEWCAESLARILRDGVPEWSRPLCHEVLNRINRNI